MTFPADHPRRWFDELRALRHEHPVLHRIEMDPRALVEGTISTSVGSRQYRLVFPLDYPLRPPIVWELRGDPPEIVRGRGDGHEFQDGSVCLFGHNAEDGWQSHFNAALALGRFRAFVETSARGEFPRIERLSFEIPLFRVSAPPRIIEAMRQGARWGQVEGLMDLAGRLMLIIEATGTNAAPLRKSGRIMEPITASWATALGLALPWAGVWCRAKNETDKPFADRTQFRTWIEREFPSPEARKLFAASHVVLVVQPKTAWFVFHNPPPAIQAIWTQAQVSLPHARVVEENLPERLFARVEDRLHAIEKLRHCRVAIVGLGSLGSTIAVALAKAGVGRFLLLDPEVLEPENVVRHVGSLRELGLPKVHVVAQAILGINPNAEIIPIPHALSLDPEGWRVETLGRVQEVARDPKGLLICTTATTPAERIVNALSVSEKRPAIFASVLGQAEHGRVFRVVPGRTPCLQCILQAQAAEPERFPRFESEEPGIPAYQQPGIPGLGMDVEQVALIAARLALQTLGEQLEGGIGYPAAHGDHFIWSNRGNWHAVDGPLQTRVERIPRNPACALCAPQSAEPLTPDEEAELRSLTMTTRGAAQES